MTKHNDTLIGASCEMATHLLNSVISREDYENLMIDELVHRFARFIVLKRSDLISVRESRPGIVRYEIRAHVMSPKELDQLIEEKQKELLNRPFMPDFLLQQQENTDD